MTRLSPLFSWRGSISESGLAPTTRHIALALSLHMNERGGSAFPSQALLARETGYHAQTVKEHLKLLREEGWLTVVREGAGTRPTEYAATVPDKGWKAGAEPPLAGAGAEVVPLFDEGVEDHFRGVSSTPGVEDTPVSRTTTGGSRGHPQRTSGGRNRSQVKTSSLPSSARAENRQPSNDLRQRAVEELWNVLVQERLEAPHGGSHRRSFAKTVGEMVDAGIAPERLREGVRLYRRHPTLGRTMLTVHALWKHLAQLEAEAKPQTDPLAAARAKEARLREERERAGGEAA